MSGSRASSPRRPKKFRGLEAELHEQAREGKLDAVRHGHGVCEDCGGEQSKGINVVYKKGHVKCHNGAGCRARQKRAARKAERDDG